MLFIPLGYYIYEERSTFHTFSTKLIEIKTVPVFAIQFSSVT